MLETIAIILIILWLLGLVSSYTALYTGPFALTSNVTVSANAYATGYNTSVASNAVFNVLPGVVFSAPGFSSGSFQFSISGIAGKTYLLQASSDLKTWTTLSTNMPGTSPFVLSDPGATNFPARYYRAVQLP